TSPTPGDQPGQRDTLLDRLLLFLFPGSRGSLLGVRRGALGLLFFRRLLRFDPKLVPAVRAFPHLACQAVLDLEPLAASASDLHGPDPPSGADGKENKELGASSGDGKGRESCCQQPAASWVQAERSTLDRSVLAPCLAVPGNGRAESGTFDFVAVKTSGPPSGCFPGGVEPRCPHRCDKPGGSYKLLF